MFALAVHYNGQGPFVAMAKKRSQLSAMLYTTDSGLLSLVVKVARDDEAGEYVVQTLGPGDTLRFQYDILTDDMPESIQGLPLAERTDRTHSLRGGHRIALDITDAPEASREGLRGKRISHPDGGGFQLILGTIPRDHARVFVMASNERERWNWQLPDLHSGDALAFEVQETTWCTPFPDVSLQDINDNVAALEMLFRTSKKEVVHEITHTLFFDSEAAASVAAQNVAASGFTIRGPWGADDRWFIRAQHNVVPTEDSLREARERLKGAAADAEYGGWKGRAV